MNVNIKLEDGIPMLRYAKLGDAGLDLVSKEVVIIPGDGISTVHTGVRVEIPEGFYGMLVPRSSTGKLGLMLSNTVGIIDSSYRGEIMCKLWNRGHAPVVVKELQAVCQLVIQPYLNASLTLVSDLSKTERGEDGFGSSDEEPKA